MLQRALSTGLKPAWVVGDEVYGRDGTLRRFLEALHQPYVLAVASNTHVWRGFYQVKPGELVAQVPEVVWVRLSAGAGAKGPRLYDWARVRLNTHLGLSRWLLLRRSLGDGELAFYIAHARSNASLEAMAWAAGSRWAVEECFELAKGEVGLSDYEVRTWRGLGHRHALPLPNTRSAAQTTTVVLGAADDPGLMSVGEDPVDHKDGRVAGARGQAVWNMPPRRPGLPRPR